MWFKYNCSSQRGNCPSLHLENLLILQGPAEMLSPPGATLYSSHVLISIPSGTTICVHTLDDSFIDHESLEDRLTSEAFSDGSKKQHWQTQFNE